MTTRFVHIGQLATLAGPHHPRVGLEMSRVATINDGAMVIEDGKIAWVGQTDDLPQQPVDAEIDLRGKVVTPGFVDAHTHAVFADNRCHEFQWRCEGSTYQDIKERGGGILSSVRATRRASADELLAESRKHASWMLACGTTTAEVKSGYGLDPETEIKMLQVAQQLAPLKTVGTFLGAHAVPPDMDRAEYLDRVMSTLPKVSGLAKFCDIFVEAGYFEAQDARRLMAEARAAGLKPRVHADQFSDSGGARLAAELSAQTADHLEFTGSDGIRALAESGVFPVLLPASVYSLGLTKYPDARAMIEAELPVVIATDFNPGSSPTPSIPLIMSLACTQMKMTPAEALTACTINAAYALDLGDSVGSLEAGKDADFVVHDCEDFAEIAYWVGRNTVESVYVEGRPVQN